MLKRKLSTLLAFTLFGIPVLTFLSSCDFIKIDKHEHDFTEKIVDSSHLASRASCSEKATYYYSCSICGLKSDNLTFEDGDLLPHSFTRESTDDKYLKSPATCTEYAKYYYSCEYCGEKSNYTFESGPLKEHVFSLKDTSEQYLCTEKTCTTEATYFYLCDCCGAAGTETWGAGEVLPHTYDQKVVDEKYHCTDPDCVNKETYYYSCKCGAKGIETFEVGNYGNHDFSKKDTSEKYLAIPATCTTKAKYFFSCSICGEKSSEMFESGDVLPHTYDQKVVDEKFFSKPATCQNKETYFYSCKCGAKGTDTFEIGVLGPHNFDQKVEDSKYFKEKATTEHGNIYYYSCECGECGTETFDDGNIHEHSFTEEVPNSEYLANEATCTEQADYYYSCECGECGTETFKYGPLKEHTVKVYDLVTKGNRTEDPVFSGYCKYCGEFVEDIIPLPDGYTKVDAIIFDGNEFITTDIKVYGYSYAFWGRVQSDTNDKDSSVYGLNSLVEIGFYPGGRCQYWNDVTKHLNLDDYLHNNQVFEFGAEQTETTRYYTAFGKTASDTKVCECTGNTLQIGAFNGEFTFEGKFYQGYMLYEGKVIHYFVPVINTNTNECGLFDLVDSKFYISDSGKSFAPYIETNETHVHNYNLQIPANEYLCSEASCMSPAQYYYSCECGECSNETFKYGEKIDHKMIIDSVKDLTLGNSGCYVAHCSMCEKQYEIGFSAADSKDYNFADYIELTGSQYFVIGNILNGDNYEITSLLEMTDSSSPNCIVSSSPYVLYFGSAFNGMLEGSLSDGSIFIDDGNLINQKSIVKFHSGQDGYYIQKGTTKSRIKDSCKFDHYDLVFGAANYPTNTYLLNAKVYYLTIEVDGETVRYFIPMVDKDGNGALYDLITHKIYRSAGEEFVGGSIIEEDPTKFSLQNTSKQYLRQEATCDTPALYFYSNSLGQAGLNSFFYGDTLEHKFKESVTKYPTNNSKGIITCTCVNCGFSYSYEIDAIDKDEYEVLNFIESKRGQYVDTGLVIEDKNQSAELNIDMQKVNLNVMYLHDLNDFDFCLGSNYFLRFYNFWDDTDRFNLNLIYNPLGFSEQVVIKNGKVYSETYFSQTYSEDIDEIENVKILIFAMGDTGNKMWSSPKTTLRVYSCNIILDNEVKRVYLPVLDKQTNRPGLYDCVEKKFYDNSTNDGSSFYYQRNDSLDDFTLLDSIKIDTNHYIDTGVTMHSTWWHKLKFDLTGADQILGYSNYQKARWGIDKNGYYFLESSDLNKSTLRAGGIDEIMFYFLSDDAYIEVNGNSFHKYTDKVYAWQALLGHYIIGGSENGANPCSFTLYSTKFQNGQGSYELIPVRRNSDGLEGLFNTEQNYFCPLTEFQPTYMDEKMFGPNNIYDNKLAIYGTNLVGDMGNYNYNIDRTGAEFWYQGSVAEANSLTEVAHYFHYKNEVLETEHTSEFQLFKKDVFRNGQIYHIYHLTVGGTSGVKEWASDMTVGIGDNCFSLGFELGADFVLGKILKYIGNDVEHNKIFITGHSRGAAVGGIISAKLIENYKLFSKDNVYTYLFATPNYSCRNNVYYDNIFAVNGPEDLVARIPLAEWGYHHEGPEIILPSEQSVISELDNYLYKSQENDREPAFPPYGYIGQPNINQGLQVIYSLCPTKELLSYSDVIDYVADLFYRILDGERDINKLYLPVLGAAACAINHGMFISPTKFLNVFSYIITNLQNLFSTHGLDVYQAWLHVMEQDYRIVETTNSNWFIRNQYY